jgi:endonuclease/exonuclease/phosphatase (EEP) superfamily protein YafD
MTILFLITLSILTLATVVPISRNSRWWIRVLDFPRLQLLLLSIVTASTAIFYIEGSLQLVTILISLACGFYHLYWIYPYTPLATPEVPLSQQESQDSTISILTANVLMTNRSVEQLITIVRDKNPDILLTLESNKWWEEKLTCLERDYPFSVKCPLENLYGMHLYSKFVLHESSIEYLVEEHVPSIHTEIELPNGNTIRVHCLHPSPPVPEYSTSSSKRDAEIIVVAKSLQDCEAPTLVAGDLNDVAWSETTVLFRKISGLLDPRVGRGMYNTFNAFHWYMRWPLDHLFHSKHFQLCDIDRPEKFGSDHFALYTKLAFKSSNDPTKNPPVASKDDNDFANEKLDQEDMNTKDVPFDDSAK